MANGPTKCGRYLLRFRLACGLARGTVRPGAPGLGGWEVWPFWAFCTVRIPACGPV